MPKPASSSGPKAWLVLETGEIYEGRSFGAHGEALGEVVFNTATTGYVEVLTDPSYHGQLVVMTQPHIGNYGVQNSDFESGAPAVAGFCVLELTPDPRHSPGGGVDAFLAGHGIVGIQGVPTRELAVRLRRSGSSRGLLTTVKASAKAWLSKVRRSPRMTGRALAAEVTAAKPYLWGVEAWEGARRVAVIDFGVKRSLLDELKGAGCAVKVFPASSPAGEVLAEEPDAVVLSNGPGDPAADPALIRLARELLEEKKPLLGICLGHQLLALAAGAKTGKLPFGHHGVNHPVREQNTGRILITTQNHGFAVRRNSLPRDYAATHVSLNDGTLEGFRHKRRPVVAYQFHPEAGPGPTETRELLRGFLAEL